MDLNQLPKFENTRGRFVRVSDLTEFRGWVAGERNLRLVIQFEGSHNIEAGQELYGEIFLLEWSVKMRCKVVQAAIKDGPEPITAVVLDCLNMNAVHGSGRERFRVRDLLASVHTRTARLAGECPVIDISADGLGIILPEEPREGTLLKVQIDQGGESYTFDTEVRYARPSDKGFRTGLLIRHHDRVTERKWRRYLSSLNERTKIAA